MKGRLSKLKILNKLNQLSTTADLQGISNYQFLLTFVSGVPKLIGSGDLDASKHYIIMSYEGEDVRPLPTSDTADEEEVINDWANYSSQVNSILCMCQQVVEQLQNLHSMGYVHWDVKPSNILKNSDNS